MLLRLNHATHFFNGRLIFKDVCHTIAAGSITLLAGANGAGKSTLLRIMAGLLSPSEGNVEYADTLAENRHTIGYLGHQHFLYPEMTALENLAFWGAWNKGSHSGNDFETALATVELLPFAEEKVCGFSRGMVQRLSLARVFMQKPALMLLDEPASGLDVRSSGILLREIRNAKDSGTAIIWISHHLEQDMAAADHILYLDKKKLAFSGTAEEFMQHPLLSTAQTPSGNIGTAERANV